MITRRNFLTAAALVGFNRPGAFPSSAGPAGADAWKQAFDGALAKNPALLGWQGVKQERLACDSLAMEGHWPKGLTGTLYRNGPAGHEVGDRRYHHWFDGDGMVQAFDISENGIRHLGRFVGTAKRRAETDAGQMLWPAFGTPLPGSRPVMGPDTLNAANISLLHHAGELLALWEAGSPYRLDPESLETLGLKAWRDDLRGLPFTAHPKVEPDGTLWAFGYALPGNLLVLYRIDPAGRLAAVGKIEVADLGMVHDFVVTAHHLVFVLPPLVFDAGRRMDSGFSFLDAHVWRPGLGTRVLAVRKDDFEKRRWWQLPPAFTFHFGNAWEDGESIRFDYCVAPDARVLTDTFRDVMRGLWRPPAEPARFAEVVLGKGDAVEQTLFDGGAEFPRVAPGVVGRRHRHVYSLAGKPYLDRVARWDLDSGEAETWAYGDGFIPEEHIFVPRPGATAEADGWVVGTALDLARGITQLAAFDARHIGDGPLAVARLPYALPLGLHGIFVPA